MGESEALREKLADAQLQIESARRAGIAELAAARDQLTTIQRETITASEPVAEARQAQRLAEAELAACRAALSEREAEAVAAREEAVVAWQAHEEEARTRGPLTSAST